ncbi:Lrp/AsnC ligand binding domain-containing protein [Altericroceibacterium endophyticum]|uniref:AsnC family transcriptional regulator n=1 Tax=Altericroceibacterium endophyticum TaxID=1808508 RepID=A0A6I4T914_9SPHN|nr:AsnC family transcriptional regulator [Altericroceibacterium endophyticum]
MSDVDRALLRALQADSSRPLVQLAEQLGLSTSACHRRIKALEERGIITGYVAQLDPLKFGYSLIAFVEITLASQSRAAMEAFEEAVAEFDQILECHLMTGGADYILRIIAPDLEAFSEIHRDYLSQLPGVSSMRSSFSIKTVKLRSQYPA